MNIHPVVFELQVIKEKAHWVPPPSQAVPTLVTLAKPPVRVRTAFSDGKAVFPFPPRECFSKERAQPPRSSAVQQESPPPAVLPMSSLLWGTPFWYNGSLRRPKKPVGDPDEYGFCSLLKSCDPVTTERDVEVDDSRYYIPGQIADAAKCPVPVIEVPPEDLPPPPVPLYESRVPRYRPPAEHYLVDPWAGSSIAELAQIGSKEYRTKMYAEHYKKYPPGPQPPIMLRRCDYPDLKLSVF